MTQNLSIQNGELVTIIKTAKKFFSSIRTKLLISYLLIGLVPLWILMTLIFASIEKHYTNEKKTLMLRQANIISINLFVNGFINDPSNTFVIDSIGKIVHGQIIVLDSRGIVIYDSNNLEIGKLYATEEALLSLQGQTKFYVNELKVGTVYTPVVDDKQDKVLGAIIITSSMEDIYNAIENMRSMSITLLFAIILLILVISYYFSGIITNPFKKLIHSINKITDGHIDKRVTIEGSYEIQQIGQAINHMTERLNEIDDSRQEFVANVSHELKTPLTSVNVLAESLLLQENVPEELYKEFLTDITNEINRETNIINDLLTLVKLDKKEYKLNIESVQLNELIELTLKRLKPLADMKNIEMIFESFREVTAEIDKTKITLAITNLVENAIKYNKEYGWIKVKLNSNYENAYISVKDSGVGIPKDIGDKIFQRFYRVDKARTRETGGTGLGLAIAQKAILMHHGWIKCDSEFSKGTTFTLSLPLKYYSNM